MRDDRLSALIRAVLCATVVALAPLPAEAGAGQVYLVQASGWMDGYLNNTAGAFRRRIARFVELTRQEGWPIAVASFDSHAEATRRADGCSPHFRFPTDGCTETADLAPWSAAGVARAIDGITIPLNETGGLANAFLEEALLRTRIIELGDAPEGIVWIVTNNKNAPIGTMAPREVFASSAAFMKKLRNGWDDLGASGVVALPVEMTAQSAAFPQFGLDHGFMIYGVAFGEIGLKLLRHVVEQPALIAEFGRSFRIRPLESEALRLSIRPQQVEGGVDVEVDGDQDVYVTGAEVGRSVPLRLEASLENTIYPYVVRKAALHLSWLPDETAREATLGATIDPPVVEGIAPGEARQITVSLDFSAVRPEGVSSLKSEAFVSSGRLKLDVADIEIDRDPEAVRRLRRVFLGEAASGVAPAAEDLVIPEIFLEGRRLAHADGVLPLRFQANAYPVEAILRLLAAIFAFAAGALAVAHFARRRPQFVVLDGQRVKLNLRPFERTTYTAASGRTYAVTGGLFGERSARATPTV